MSVIQFYIKGNMLIGFYTLNILFVLKSNFLTRKYKLNQEILVFSGGTSEARRSEVTTIFSYIALDYS